MARGYILLHRQIWDNKIWKDKEPFDKRSAWIDLLMMANHADNDMIVGMKNVTVKRGEIHTSISNLAKRWRWSDNKVKRFLHLLSEQEMVHTSGLPYGTRVTIVKYEVFQAPKNVDGLANEPANEPSNEPANEPANGLQTNNVINNVSKNETNNVRKKSYKRPAGEHSSSLKAWEELERRIEGNG